MSLIEKIKLWWFDFWFFARWYRGNWTSVENGWRNTKTGKILTDEYLRETLSLFGAEFFGFNQYEMERVLDKLARGDNAP